jgi:hypothetical protein
MENDKEVDIFRESLMLSYCLFIQTTLPRTQDYMPSNDLIMMNDELKNNAEGIVHELIQITIVSLTSI